MKRLQDPRLALVGVGLFVIVLSRFLPTTSPMHTPDWVVAERECLERQLEHTSATSPEAFKLQKKLARLDAHAMGSPDAGFPDLFARTLHDMRVPGDRLAPEYLPGYQVRELQAAKARRISNKAFPLPWVNRGPGNVAGRTRAIVVDPDDATGSTWFIAAVGGGIWKTTNSGATWVSLTDEQPHLQTSTLALSQSNAMVLYAGTGESFYSVSQVNGNGILKSSDKGQSWVHLASTVGDLRFNNISRIIVDPDDEDVLVVSATAGRFKEAVVGSSSIFRSTDGGASFVEVYRETDLSSLGYAKRVHQVIADPTDFRIQYATIDEKGILKSSDGGQNWAPINAGIPQFAGRFELAIHPMDPSRLYASAEGVGHCELYVSTNAGASWSETFETGTEPNWLRAQGSYDNTIVCHPTDVNTVYVGGIQLWKIVLSGTNRVSTLMNTGDVHVDHHAIVVAPLPGGEWRLLNTNDGGVGVAAFHDTGWTAPISGLTTTQFFGADKRPGASAYIGGMQDNGTWRSTVDPDATTPWVYQIGGDGYEASWHFDDAEKIIACYYFNGLRRSLDGGTTWEDAVTGLGDVGYGNAPFITKIGQSDQEPDLLFAVGVSGVWRSDDFGATWSGTSIASADWGPFDTYRDVRISRANPDVVIAGARMDASGNIMVSSDRGLSFMATTQYPNYVMGRISGLATHPVDPNTLFALFSFSGRPKILRTNDLGVTWTDISGVDPISGLGVGYPDAATYDLLVFPDDPSRMWAATEIGLFESLDAGATWALADNGLPNVAIWQLRQVEDEVVAATHGRGVWSVKIPSMIDGVVFNPLFESLAQGLDGDVVAKFFLRSGFDQLDVTVNGQVQTFTGPEAGDLLTVRFPVLADGTVTAKAVGALAGKTYESVQKSIDAVLFAEPNYTYVSDFNVVTADLVVDGFSMSYASGFSNRALNTTHPYPDGTTLLAMLKNPIIVTARDARLEFDHVALIEPGEPGSVYGEVDFWDFAVVEGSRDGLNWVALAPGYDARHDPSWLALYNAGTAPNLSHFRHETIDLLQSFQAGDRILVRFRLFGDELYNGWGWIIDNLEIQLNSTAIDGPAGARFALEQAVPNPFNPSTTIAFSLAEREDVSLRVFDVRGRLVRTLVSGELDGGAHTVRWDGRDDGGATAASGVYLYRLRAGEKVQQYKMTLLK